MREGDVIFNGITSRPSVGYQVKDVNLKGKTKTKKKKDGKILMKLVLVAYMDLSEGSASKEKKDKCNF